MHVDQYEGLFIRLAALMMGVFATAVVIAVFGLGIQLPGAVEQIGRRSGSRPYEKRNCRLPAPLRAPPMASRAGPAAVAAKAMRVRTTGTPNPTSTLVQKWAASVVNGQTVLSTSEAGGSVTFTFERVYTPAELAVMAEEALEWVNTLADPENPPLDVARYNRLHPTFHKAVL